MKSFTIKDMSNMMGIQAHTLRIWEQRYSFIKPDRTGTNIRFYSNEELKKMLNIALLNKYGFKISHIDRMTDAEMQEKILSLPQAEAQQERIVHELIQNMIDVNMQKFELLLDNYIMARGIEKTIGQIIFPYLERIGLLWLTNNINPAQEHLVTNIIRQKLISGIERVSTSLKSDNTVLLFLPESEYHELGLLFMWYMLKNKGVSVIYLGCNVPMQDVEYIVNLKNPTHLYAHLTSTGNKFNFDNFLLTLNKKIPRIPITISGQLTINYAKKLPANIHFKKSYKEIMEFIVSL